MERGGGKRKRRKREGERIFRPCSGVGGGSDGKREKRGGKQMKCDRLRREWGEDQSGPREGIPPLFLGGGSIFGASVERKRV